MPRRTRAGASEKVRVRWPRWMQRETAAAYTDLPLRTFDIFVRRGFLPLPRRLGTHLLWLRDELDGTAGRDQPEHVDPYDEGIRRAFKLMEAERRACEIRLRAERKAGSLSAQLDKHQGARNDLTSSHPSGKLETLRKAGVSETQARRWEQLAAVPDEQFEAALVAPSKPSTASIIGKKQDPMDPRALWLWGRLRDFEREGQA